MFPADRCECRSGKERKILLTEQNMGPLARAGSGGERGYCSDGENSGGMFVDGEKWRERKIDGAGESRDFQDSDQE